jgi:polyvinyl alcohol dehydrogenase (cytochrome)
MLAIRADTGDLLWKTQLDNHRFANITQSPVVYQDRVYVGVSSLEELYVLTEGYQCCTFRGSVVALDTRTGAILWRTYMTLDNNGRTDGFSGVAVWGSTPVVDAARNTLYVTTGNNYNVPPEVKACQKKRMTNPNLPSCAVPGNHIDAVVALNLNTGTVKWSTSIEGYDAWTITCVIPTPVQRNCPEPHGDDFDFAQGAMLFQVEHNGGFHELLGVGQKSGIFWALDPETGAIRWGTRVGPSGLMGGMMWGSATDARRIYVALVNSNSEPFTLQPSGVKIAGGAWSALDAATGKILWQTAVPNLARALGPVSVANGVVYAGSMALAGDNMFALDAASGKILWRYPSGGSVMSGAAVANGVVYWGSGYSNKLLGRPNNKLFAFSFDR